MFSDNRFSSLEFIVKKPSRLHDEVDSLALSLFLKEAVNHGTYEAQLAAISRVKMLYESHFGYSDSDPVLSGLQRLQQKVRADKASSLKQTCIDTSFK